MGGKRQKWAACMMMPYLTTAACPFATEVGEVFLLTMCGMFILPTLPTGLRGGAVGPSPPRLTEMTIGLVVD